MATTAPPPPVAPPIPGPPPGPTRRTSLERQLRQTEALLLLFVLLVLGTGAFLAGITQGGRAKEAEKAVNINTASAETLAATFSVSPEVGKSLVSEREKRHGFGDVDSLGGPGFSKILPHEKFAAAAPGLVVRAWPEARNSFLWCVGGLAVFLIVSHLLLCKFAPRADPTLLPIAGLLSGLGILLLFAIKDPLRDNPSYLAQTVGVLMGGTLAILIPVSGAWGRFPVHRYGYLYAIAAVVLTALLGIAGSGPGGVRLSVAGVQPVEAIKVLMVLFLAAYLAERGTLLNDPLRRFGPFPIPRREDALPLLVLYSLPLVVFGIVRDLGPALLLFGIFLVLVFLATNRLVYVVLGVAVLLLGAYIGYKLHFGVFQTRVDMWLAPWQNSHAMGDHLARGWWGLASGGALGSGLGLGGANFIPRGGSDLAFASLGEETGVFGTIAVLVCFLVVVARGFRIAARATTDFDRYVAAGLSALLGLQTLLLVSGTLGLFPLAGITLPLISFGKSSLLMTFLIFGILMGISARSSGLATVSAPATFQGASPRVFGFFALTLGIACLLKLLYIQVVAAPLLMVQMVTTPGADKVARPHINPRLLSLANRIPRGRLLDRAGRTLAETKGRRRVYPYGPVLAHLVGYADPAVGGPTGLEAEYAIRLRGFENMSDLARAWAMKDLPGYRLPSGQDVVLTLDAELQKAALAALTEYAGQVRDKKTGKRKDRGAVVVLDVATGGVLAAVTSPTYDPNTLTPDKMQGFNADRGESPLLNRALSGYYPPGSTFKIVTTAALLAHDRGNFTTDCAHVATNLRWKEGGIGYSRKRVVDDETDRPHGHVDLSRAVAQSCNVFFARAGIELGAESLRETADTFGFAKLPTPLLVGQELPDIAYGQGPMLASPMEMASVALAVATGGERLKPLYRKDETRTVVSRPLTTDQAARLADMMRAVTETGTAAGRFSNLGIEVAGKTGTAQNKNGDRMSHSWFIGFAPARNPKVAFAVVVENAGYGASVAVPVARAVVGKALGGGR